MSNLSTSLQSDLNSYHFMPRLLISEGILSPFDCGSWMRSLNILVKSHGPFIFTFASLLANLPWKWLIRIAARYDLFKPTATGIRLFKA